MHLFLFDLFISIDNLCPIINQLPKKKIIICNINAIQSFKNDKLVNIIMKKKLEYHDYLPLSNNKKILFYLLKLILIMPPFILKKIRFLWLFIYKNFFFSSENEIENFLMSKKIKSISYEESAPKFIMNIFYRLAKKYNITVIKVASGLRTGNLNKLSKEQLSNCDYYISPNKVRGERKNQNIKKQIKYFGSLRFSRIWINRLRAIQKTKDAKSSKIQVGFFKKFFSTERLQVDRLIKKLKNNKDFSIKSREKPRDISPLKCTKFHQDEISSSKLIEMSDVLIASRSSSMLIEAAIFKKKIILLEYLNKKIIKSGIYNFKFILKAKKFEDVERLIYKTQKINNKELKRFIDKFLINFFNLKKVKRDYINFYKNLT